MKYGKNSMIKTQETDIAVVKISMITLQYSVDQKTNILSLVKLTVDLDKTTIMHHIKKSWDLLDN